MKKTTLSASLALILGLFVLLPQLSVQAQVGSQADMLTKNVEVFNDTQNLPATSGQVAREDFLTYKFVTTKSGTLAKTIAPSIDLSGILPLVDVVNTFGGTINGKQILYPATTLQPGQNRTDKLQVRVKYSLPPFKYVLNLSYGNTATVTVASLLVGGNQGNYTAPTVGANLDLLYALLLASALTTSSFFVLKKVNKVNS
jgi:hypothetical protein